MNYAGFWKRFAASFIDGIIMGIGGGIIGFVFGILMVAGGTTNDPEVLRGMGNGPRSWDRPLYALRGGRKGAGASSTVSKIAANIERGF